MEEIKQKIELTNLNPAVTSQDIEELIQVALSKEFLGICVPPFWVKKAKRDIGSDKLKLITVVGFPFGYQMTESKEAEISKAIDNGADEVDMVWNISAFKSDMNWPKIEIAKCSKLCHENSTILKVIIECSKLSPTEIKEASKINVDAGADFVKTSTGYAEYGARVEDVELIKKTIGDRAGIKAAGGIKTLEQAIELVNAGADRIGSSGAASWSFQ